MSIEWILLWAAYPRVGLQVCSVGCGVCSVGCGVGGRGEEGGGGSVYLLCLFLVLGDVRVLVQAKHFRVRDKRQVPDVVHVVIVAALGRGVVHPTIGEPKQTNKQTYNQNIRIEGLARPSVIRQQVGKPQQLLLSVISQQAFLSFFHEQ